MEKNYEQTTIPAQSLSAGIGKHEQVMTSGHKLKSGERPKDHPKANESASTIKHNKHLNNTEHKPILMLERTAAATQILSKSRVNDKNHLLDFKIQVFCNLHHVKNIDGIRTEINITDLVDEIAQQHWQLQTFHSVF